MIYSSGIFNKKRLTTDGFKRLELSVNASTNTQPLPMAKKCAKGLKNAFEAVRNKDLQQKNFEIDLLIHTKDKKFDLLAFRENIKAMKEAFASFCGGEPCISYTYQHTESKESLEFNVSFIEVPHDHIDGKADIYGL